VRKKALIAVFIILALGAAAQNNSELTIADTPVAATSNLDEIRIEGFVPNFLKISLDFAPDNSASLVGYYPSEAAASHAASKAYNPQPQGDKNFLIHPGQIVDLGMAVLVSNVVGPYTIQVISANAGQLVCSNGGQVVDAGGGQPAGIAPIAAVGIPYSLKLGDQQSQAQAGVFYFSGSGKSRSGGIRLNVSLLFDQLKPPLPHSIYTDELSFVVSAN
jgi:hypothetical protein